MGEQGIDKSSCTLCRSTGTALVLNGISRCASFAFFSGKGCHTGHHIQRKEQWRNVMSHVTMLIGFSFLERPYLVLDLNFISILHVNQWFTAVYMEIYTLEIGNLQIWFTSVNEFAFFPNICSYFSAFSSIYLQVFTTGLKLGSGSRLLACWLPLIFCHSFLTLYLALKITTALKMTILLHTCC